MKRLTIKSFILAATLSAVSFGSPFAQADTIILKDGTQLDGKVLSETDTQLVVEVQVSASISDRRTLAKSDVLEVRVTPPDQSAWEKIKGTRLPENNLDVAEYIILAAPIEEFLAAFPDSAFAAEASKTLDSIKAEQSRVAAGEIKLEGTWISAEEVMRRGDEIASKKSFMRMKSLASSGDLPGALNEFKTLEKNYSAEATYLEAAELARQIVLALQNELARRKADLDRYKAEFEQGLLVTPEHLKQGIINAAKAKEAEYDAILAQAKQVGLEFPPLIPRSENSLKELETVVKRESDRLASLNFSVQKSAVELVQRAEEAIAQNRLADVAPLIEQAKSLWNQYAGIARVEAEIAAAQEAAEAEAASKEQERLAQEAAAKEAAEAAQRAEAAAAADDTQKGDSQVTGSSSGSASEKPFYMTVPGAIGIVVALVVVLLIVTIVSKFSASKKNSEE